MSNKELKKRIKEAGFYQWQVADEMGISQYTLCIWFRKPLPPEKEQAVLDALQRLKEGVAIG